MGDPHEKGTDGSKNEKKFIRMITENRASQPFRLRRKSGNLLQLPLFCLLYKVDWIDVEGQAHARCCHLAFQEAGQNLMSGIAGHVLY